jgi:hypothetical protein
MTDWLNAEVETGVQKARAIVREELTGTLGRGLLCSSRTFPNCPAKVALRQRL